MNFRKLKSGSDIRGVAIGENVTLTTTATTTLGVAFALYVAKKTKKPIYEIKIAIGRDSRVTGENLLNACANGMASTGASVLDFAMCTTPAMYMSILNPDLALDGAIMVTASHHPWQINGLKFFTQEGGLGFHELDEVIDLAENATETTVTNVGEVTPFAYLPLYKAHLQKLIIDSIDPEVQKPLLGLHVVVDAGNGAGGFYAGMLEELGAWIEGSQFLEPDGRFPNHVPNPESKVAMDSISSAVLGVQADIGVIFDADCDRAAIVDEKGKPINRNRLIALISAILLEKTPGATIVTESVTSSGLADFIQEWGGVHYRYKRGYRNVIDEAMRLTEAGIDCPLAIETSGHAALRDNHFLDDGMYLATLLLIESFKAKQQGKTLGCWLEGLREPMENVEIRLPVLGEDFATVAKQAIETVMDYAAMQDGWQIANDNREGIRIFFDADDVHQSAWFLLRLSVHDPVMPLNAESDVPGGVAFALSKLYEVLQTIPGIDSSALASYQ